MQFRVSDDDLPTWYAQEGHEFYGRDQFTEAPGFDCLSFGCMLVMNVEPGAFKTNDGMVPRANWCLWCGGASTNEYVPEEEPE
jgi:hypothetical protein